MVININENIKCIYINDDKLDLFEGQFPIANGITYNTYIIFDNKIAVLDTVDQRFSDVWMSELNHQLGHREPDYLIIHHMEPDHSGSLKIFLQKYRNTLVVGNFKTFQMIKNFFFELPKERMVVISENDILDLGNEKLKFILSPMVHWPEVMMSYSLESKIFFSADAFGKFGDFDFNNDWLEEARRYYFGIVGKYGFQTNNLIKKIENLDIKMICPLHGSILSKSIKTYIDLYRKWANYEFEKDGVLIVYTSIYGNTKKAVDYLVKLFEIYNFEFKVFDIARCDIYEAIQNAFKYKKIIIATTTYNNDIFPIMKYFLNLLTDRNYQNRVVGIIENGTWAPAVVKVIKSILDKSKNLVYAKNIVYMLSSLKEDNLKQIELLAEEIVNL